MARLPLSGSHVVTSISKESFFADQSGGGSGTGTNRTPQQPPPFHAPPPENPTPAPTPFLPSSAVTVDANNPTLGLLQTLLGLTQSFYYGPIMKYSRPDLMVAVYSCFTEKGSAPTDLELDKHMSFSSLHIVRSKFSRFSNLVYDEFDIFSIKRRLKFLDSRRYENSSKVTIQND
ncbi:unnamed protein product [Arabis nemorensis]|uniref:Uncharacterized protein n=1 Tax=Arabis nemorensis TaxID=586526 RepID=A0A565BPJ4_9BRAS|nr:unnamed protein product [Arabis nemorensis]